MNRLLARGGLTDIADRILAGRRLSPEDGLRLLVGADVLALGCLANLVRERLHQDQAFYIVNRHINHSNICVNRCQFCAFSRSAGEPGAYTMSVEEVLARASEFREGAVSEFHIVGGLHPELPFEYYLEVLRTLKSHFPAVHLQAFTAVEIAHLADIGGLSVRECLLRLKEAGLGSLPGGGAEVFSARVRARLCPDKLPAEGWLEVMRTAHAVGLRSNATILYGHIETPEEVIDHLVRLRTLQDETGGFLTFIPLAFHPQHTFCEGEAPPTTGVRDLRMVAVSRLMLDNFAHIKVFWIMLGVKLAQVALSFGADDLDGTVVEERITHAAGASTPEGLTEQELRRLIREAGRVPVRRGTLYDRVEPVTALPS